MENKVHKFGLVIVAAFLYIQVNAAVKTVVASGNYNVAAVWSGGTLPVSGDDIVVPAGKILTLNITPLITWGSLDVNGTLQTVASTTIQFPSITAATITGSGTIISLTESTTPWPANKTWNTRFVISRGPLQYIPAGQYTSLIANGGNRTFSGRVRISDSLTISMGAPTYVHNTAGSNIEFNGSGDQVIPTNFSMSLKFDTLTISGSGTKSSTSRFSVSKHLDVESGAILLLNNSLLDSGSAATDGFTTAGSGTIKMLSNYLPSTYTYKLWTPEVWYASTGPSTITALRYTNLTLSGGSRTFSTANEIYIEGELDPSGATITSSNYTINFKGNTNTNTNQQIPCIQYYNLKLSGYGTRTFADDDTIKISGQLSVIGMSGSPAIISDYSTVEFNGSFQNIPSFTFNNLVLDGSNPKTATGTITVNGELSIFNTLDMATYRLMGALTCNPLANSSVLRTACTLTTPLPVNKTWYSTVKYTSPTTSQYVVSGQYKNLVIDTGVAKVLSPTDTIKISGYFTAGLLGHTQTGSTIMFNGETTQNVTSLVAYNNLVIGGSGVKWALGTMNVVGRLTVNSTFDLDSMRLTCSRDTIYGTGIIRTGDNSVVNPPIPTGKTWLPDMEFYFGANQNIPPGQYNNINTTGGQRTFLTTDSIKIKGNFIGGSGPFVTTNSSVVFNGGNQTIAGITYYNLTASGTGIKTASGNMGVTNKLTLNSTLDIGTYTLTGVASNAGAGWLRTGAGTMSIPTGKVWTPGVEYYGGTLNIDNSATYKKLAISGTGTKSITGTLTVQDSLAVNTGAVLNMGSYTFNGSTFKTSGAGTITTQNTSQTPLPLGLTWVPKVVFNYTGPQRIPQGTYNKLELYNNTKTVVSDITVNDSLVVGAVLFPTSPDPVTFYLNGYISYSGIGYLSPLTNTSIAIGGTQGDNFGSLYFNYMGGTLSKLIINRSGGPNASVSLQPGAGGMGILLIDSILVLNNATLYTNNMLRFSSDSLGSAGIAQITGGGTVVGDIYFNRYINAYPYRRYRFMSSPSTNASMWDYIDDIIVTGPGGAASGFDASPNNNPSIFTYNETVPSRGWVGVSSMYTTFQPGTGHLVFVRGNRFVTNPFVTTSPTNSANIDYYGPLNQGDISPVLSYTNTGNVAQDGFNAVGNPYVYAINWNLLTKQNLSPFYYTYNPATGSFMANDGSQPISAYQGFFVQALGSGPSITFKESAKVAAGANVFFKNNNEVSGRITVSKDSFNSDFAVIKFVSGASATYSPAEDAPKFATSNPDVNISFYTSDNIKVQYNSVSDILSTVADSFPVHIAAQYGSYTLSFSDFITLYPGKLVYIYDRFTGSTIDLRTVTQYSFTVSSDTLSRGKRFQLIISEPSALPVKLLSFNAHAMANDVVLQWSTAQEINHNRFELERSFDAKDFELAGVVYGRGQQTSTVNQYSFTDAGILGKGNGVMYYRLKQVDNDGTVSYSNVVAVHDEKVMNELNVYPNPAATQVWLKLPYNISGSYTIQVYDQQGVCRLVQSELSIAGETAKQIDITKLSSGVYTVTVTPDGGGAAMNARLIKL